eukprot:TRINITY_DN995_c0_g1_i2.p1 TRINITY_DN995_c0_g1~~TRINITY_DN995_c0_g1_i2.p1  ORF type:complete len:154 (+),score=19.65 TRINITY_DN995_c0_g1_i2:143-604(+)
MSYMDDPGPGTYRLPSTLEANSHALPSKFRTRGRIIISPGKRFVEDLEAKAVPGPGTYSSKDSITGRSVLSTRRSVLAPMIPKSKRAPIIFKSSETPGPGSYGLYSDFAVYRQSAPTERASSVVRKRLPSLGGDQKLTSSMQVERSAHARESL